MQCPSSPPPSPSPSPAPSSDDIGEERSEILGSDNDVLEEVDTSDFIEVILST